MRSNVTIEGAVRKLGYNVPTTEQKDAVTAFVRGRGVFSSLFPRVTINRCATCAYLTYRATRLRVPAEYDHYSSYTIR